MAEDKKNPLGTFKGYRILETKLIINKLGDGLSKAVGIEPVVIAPNEPAFVGVRVRKTKDRYDFVRDESNTIIGVILVQIFDATGAAFVEEKAIGKRVQNVVDAIAADEAMRKDGQMTLEIPRAAKEVAKYGDLGKQVDDAMRESGDAA
jgi:hypothetical protein